MPGAMLGIMGKHERTPPTDGDDAGEQAEEDAPAPAKAKRRRSARRKSADADVLASPVAEQDLARVMPDQTEAEVEALLCALRAAPGLWLAQKTLQQLVTDTSRFIDTYSRALHLIERRTVHAHLAPAARRAGPVQPLPNPARLDPWSCDPREIEDASRVVSICPTCNGTETVLCGRCRGSDRINCGNCGGSGRVQGQRGMKNCGVCRGKGTQPCGACTHGRVPCDPCGATGKVHAWLSISQDRIPQVLVHPMGAAALVHKRLKSPKDFDADPKIWVNELTSDTGDQASNGDLPSELEPELNAVTDRVLATRVQSFSSVVHQFSYQAVGMTGVIDVAGSPPAVSKSSNWRPLRIRQIATAATAACLGMGSLMLAGSYTARHVWYADYGHGRLIALLGIALAGLLAAVLAGLLLPRRLWSSVRVRAPLGLAGVAALGLLLAWKYPGPSMANAKRALEDKDLERAEVEAKALRDLSIDPRGAAEVLDDLHIERLKKITTFDDLAVAVREPWNLDERRLVGLSVLHEIGEQKKTEFYGAKNASGLTSLVKSVGDLDPSLRDSSAAHSVLLQAEQCIAQSDCACVTDRLKTVAGVEAVAGEATRIHDQAVTAFSAAIKELLTPASLAPARDPHDRQKSLRQALSLARCYADLAAAPSEPAPPAIEALLLPVNLEVEVTDKRAAALAAIAEALRRQQEAIAEAKRKQEEAVAEAKRRQEEALERAREAQDEDSSGGTMCADGTMSSSTGRGTCSHHGGISGGSHRGSHSGGRRGRHGRGLVSRPSSPPEGES